MKSPFLLLLSCLLVCRISWAQSPASKLVSGPWAGNVELRTATIWAEVKPAAKKVAVQYYPEGKPGHMQTVVYTGPLGKAFNPVKLELGGLTMNTSYQYQLLIDGQLVKTPFATRFRTKELWQWRKTAPDFSFLTGSCAYFNEPEFDRPGKPYGGDSSIFETMARTPAAFHLGLGDNWYTREVDYSSPWGLQYRASRDRSLPVLQAFLASMPQYFIWDDHDYGPNDMGKSYVLKEASRKVFMDYTCNPAYGFNGEGIFSQFSYSDVDFFLTDDRYFRSEAAMPDSVNGEPNPEKSYFGKAQLDWLKNALLYSKATFKIIASGSQILNPYSDYDCMREYQREHRELLNFLAENRIRGVLFFTGDRHHSEVIRVERPGMYPLYDVTHSPYTSGVGRARGREADNPARVPGTLVEAQNFSRVEVSGAKGNRQLRVRYLGLKGEELGSWQVSEKELQ